MKYDESVYLFYMRPVSAEMGDHLSKQKQARLASFSQHDGTQKCSAKESGNDLQSGR